MVESERFAWHSVVALLSRGSEVETIAHVLARPDPPPIIESGGGGGCLALEYLLYQPKIAWVKDKNTHTSSN